MKSSFTLSSFKLNLLTILAVFGLGISIVQTNHFASVRSGRAAIQSFCTIGKTFDCNAVDASPYAELAAGIPLSAAAAGWWLALLVFSLLARSSEFASGLSPWIFGMTAVGALASLFYLWIMMSVLKVGCLLCLAIDVVNFAAFAAMVHSWLQSKRASLRVPSFKMPVIVTCLSLFVTVVFAKGRQEGVPPPAEIQMQVQSVLATQKEPRSMNSTLISLGNPAAKVTIVKFSDFQCPSCRIGAQSLHPVMKRYGDQVQFIYRNFPLDMKCNRVITNPMHPLACDLAKGAVCAHFQGKFEPYYEEVFTRQESLRPESLMEIARQIQLNLVEFENCLKDSNTTDKIIKDIEEGISLNIESTPTFFINGRRVKGALAPQVWNQVIDELLKKPE